MLDDTLLPESFVTHSYSIPGPRNQTYYLIPFGDVHRFSPLCAEDRWFEFLSWARTKKRAHFFGMGDYTDLLSGAERRVFRANDLHESTEETLEAHYDSLLDKFEREIGWMRGKLVGLMEGNHHVKFMDGSTSTQRLCRRLGCKYLGDACFVRLHFTGNGHTVSATVFAAHGISMGGRTISGGMNAVEKMEPLADADLYLQGHNHQKGALPFARLHLAQTCNGLKVVQRKGFFVRTGSFLRGYVPGKRSYVAKRLLRPTDLGVCKIEITPIRKRSGGTDSATLDIHVSV